MSTPIDMQDISVSNTDEDAKPEFFSMSKFWEEY